MSDLIEYNLVMSAASGGTPVYGKAGVDAELAKRDKEIEELKAEIDLRGKRMELLWKVLMLDESEQYHYEGYDELRSWFDNDGQIKPREVSL